MENSTIGIVILVLTLTAFVAVGGWFVWAARNWAWPKGTKVEGKFEDFRCTVILSKGAKEEVGEETASLVARAGALAASCCASAWDTSGIDPSYNPSKDLSHTVIHLLTDEEYTQEGTAAILWKVGKRVGGDSLPMTITKTKYVTLLLDNGEPHVHEMCHRMVMKARNDNVVDPRAHHDSRVWEATGGQRSIQAVAKAKFKTGSSQLNV